jgi:hypothetical protein
MRRSTWRTSGPVSSRFETRLTSSWFRSIIDLVGCAPIQRIVWSVFIVQADDETPIVLRLSFRTGGTPGTERLPRSYAR